MKKKNLAWLTLGIPSILVPTIIASCAALNSQENSGDSNTGLSDPGSEQNNPENPNSNPLVNPPSDTKDPIDSNPPVNTNNLDNLITVPGQSLQQSQINFYSKLAKDVETKFDANQKLKYDNEADKLNIDNQIKEYESKIKKSSINALSEEIAKLDESSTSYSTDLSNLVVNFYENFKQKNILPTQSEVEVYINGQGEESGVNKNWKRYVGQIAVFYTEIDSIILLLQTDILSKNETERENVLYGLAYSGFNTQNLIKTSMNEDGPAYQVLMYFNPVLTKLQDLLQKASETA